ncbi:hypothetical protein Syun_017043 [Stephania yunnanensis]|uniref:Pentatricopeptide repeat-containing protein n=1 Tax=Stephania yunnanensis TaxID=152371 RepID=A0AAP0P5G6_9MAGN
MRVVSISVLVEVGLFVEAKKLFDKMFNYGVVMFVGSCKYLLWRLSNNADRIDMAIKVFGEFPRSGVCWNQIRLETKGGKNLSIMLCTNGILLKLLVGSCASKLLIGTLQGRL